jgi:hypothetical protein
MGIQFAWPIDDPNSAYQNLRFTGVYGDYTYDKVIPADIPVK